MSSTEWHIVLDRPWQIELARLQTLKHYCVHRANRNPFVKQRRTLASMREEFDWLTARTWRAAAVQFADFVRIREAYYGINGICPFCEGSGYNDEDELIAEEYLDDCPDCLGTGKSRFARGLDPVTGEPM